MVTGALFAHGTLLKVDDGGGVTFTTIAEVGSISGPSLTQATIDVTSMDSANHWREFIGGLKDGGNVTFDINYIPTGGTHNVATGVIGMLSTGVKRSFKLVFTDGGSTTWTFIGWITKFTPTPGLATALKGALDVKITGQPTLV